MTTIEPRQSQVSRYRIDMTASLKRAFDAFQGITMKINYFRLIVPFVALLLWADGVHAYLDMGSGSYMIQIFLAGLLGALFILKSYWKRAIEALVSFIKNRLFPKQ